ncbi:hypothetical protein [Maribellus mangrovi]|uniref:hypothetical protein n=1 Tax=Maribellus mangrovi TaxID=3133146 RepID=UPI0030EE71EF
MKYKSFTKLLLLAFGLVFMLASCTKEGPMGPAGADGADGADGTDGTDGVDGNLSCLVCHSAETMDAITTAFEMHAHNEGGSWGRGTSASCGRCHSSDGFVEFARSGEEIGAAVSTPLTCKTCHVNHSSLEDDIPAPVRELGVVEFIAVPGTDWDYEAGNLCATCHQARRPHTDYYSSEATTATRTFTGDDIAVYQAHGAVGPNGTKTLNATEDTLTVVFDVPTTHVYTNSTHAGPHHGPQANIIAANIGTQMGTPFEQAHHQCVNCHMHGEDGASGHSFEADLNMCNECHGDLVDVEGEQDAIAARMAAVEAALEDLGAIHVAEDGVHPMYASLPKAQWDAFWNFMCLWEDKSHGVHNFGYASQLLNQAENALGIE